MTRFIILIGLIALYACSDDAMTTCQLTHSFDTCFTEINR